MLLIAGAVLCGLPVLAVLLGLLRLDAGLVGFTSADLAVLAAGAVLLVTWFVMS